MTGFPRAKLEENFKFCGTDNVLGQIRGHIFQIETIVAIIVHVFFYRNSRDLENGANKSCKA